MKKLIYTIIMMIALSVSMVAQNVPRGLNYQAVVRDEKGLVLADQDIKLTVKLLSLEEGGQQINEYIEMHYVSTNELGLFNIVIGEGMSSDCDFDDIPWGTKDIWMEMAIDMHGDGDFVVLDRTRLLTVPYAFHAGTATAIAGEEGIPNVRGSYDKGSWLTFGNDYIDSKRERLGTINEAPLIIVTNNEERIRIGENGGILMMQELMLKGHFVTTGHAEVYGDLNLGDNLIVASDIFGGGSMVLSGDGSFDALDIKNDLRVGNDIYTGRDLFADRNLEVEGKSYLEGNVGIGIQPNDFYKLSVKGNIDLDGGMNLKGDLDVDGALQVLNGMEVSANTDEHVAIFANLNQGSGDGIAIQLGNTKTSSENNFVTFYNGNGGVTGRIEGFDLSSDILEDFPLPGANVFKDFACLSLTYENPLTYLTDAALFYVNLPGYLWNEASIPGFSWPVPPISLPSVGLSDLFVWPEVPSTQELSVLALGCPEYDANSSFLPEMYPDYFFWRTNVNHWINHTGMQELAGFSFPEMISKAILLDEVSLLKDGGVTYGSKGADYAEYLPKLNANEIFLPGEIVGVFGGKISKKTESADQVLAISSKPLVLGNQPDKGEEMNFEKVGFLGQVPVFVKGNVNIGDFILPSGLDNGIGRAVAPGNITLDEIPQVIGRAWSPSNGSMSLINVSIGMKPAEFVPILQKQADRLDAIEAQLDAIIN